MLQMWGIAWEGEEEEHLINKANREIVLSYIKDLKDEDFRNVPTEFFTLEMRIASRVLQTPDALNKALALTDNT